jgi:ribosomal protein S1
VFVELAPGKSGLVHLSELAEEGTLTEVPPEWKVRVCVFVLAAAL